MVGREPKALGAHLVLPNILQRPKIFSKTDRILPISPVKNYPMGQKVREKSVERQCLSFAILAHAYDQSQLKSATSLSRSLHAFCSLSLSNKAATSGQLLQGVDKLWQYSSLLSLSQVHWLFCFWGHGTGFKREGKKTQQILFCPTQLISYF